MRLRGYSPSAVPALSYVGSPDGFVVGGLPGRAATVTVGSTSTGSAGSSATVANSGTSNAAVLDFTIPRGADSTISIGTVTTGSPGSSATVTNSGTSSAAVLDFTIPQGVAGSATINGITATELGRLVATTSGGSSATDNWTKLANFATTGQYAVGNFILALAQKGGVGLESAVISVAAGTFTSANAPLAAIQMISKSGTGAISTDSFKLISGAYGTDIELWMRKDTQFSQFAVYEVMRSVAGVTATYHNNSAWQSATPTGAVNNVSTNGVTAFGVPVLTTTNTATVTNKTLTSPRVNQINDTNGNIGLAINPIASAVNYVRTSNAITGGTPTVQAWGSDTNVSLNILPRGADGAVFVKDGNGADIAAFSTVASPVNRLILSNSATNSAPSVRATGSDTNVNLNLVTRGAGTVQANGVDLVTTTGVQSLSSKTLSSPTITGTVSADMLLSGTRTTQYEAVGVSDGSRLTVGSTSHNGVGPTFFIPQIHNQLAYLTRRGGTVTVTRNGSPATLTSAAVMFEPNNLFAELSGGVSTNDSVVIEVDFSTVVSPTTSLQFGSTAGVDSRVGQSARNVTIEGWNSVTLAWESIGSITSNSTGMFARYFTGNDARTKLRYTFTNFVSTTFRITSLFAFANGFADVEGALFPRAGGFLYGTNAAPPTLTAAGSDTNIDLSLAGKGTGGVRIPTIKDSNGNIAATFSATASAVNYLDIRNAATGSAVVLVPNGSDSNCNLVLRSKGASGLIQLSPNASNAMQVIAASTPVNWWRVYSSNTGSDLELNATGSDANVSANITTRGTGVVKANGVEVATVSGTQTLSNKRLASATVPATTTSTGTTGEIAYDSTHVYICTATNTWRRAALSTW